MSQEHNMLSIRSKIVYYIDKVISDGFLKKSPELFDILNENKVYFSNFLFNQSKKDSDRLLIKNSNRNPITIEGIPQKITLSEDCINEALIISDLFDLNEFVAVDLLLTGEAESATKVEYSRGLLAIINYYQSQKTFIESFKTLLQSRSLLENSGPESNEIITFVNEYVQNLFENGLLTTLIKLIKSMNIDKEIKKLDGQKALGSGRHRRQFYELYQTIRNLLTECIMIRCSNIILSDEDLSKVIDLIRDLYKNEINDIHKPDTAFLNLLASCMATMTPKHDHKNDISDYDIDLRGNLLVDEYYQKTISKKLHSNLNNIAGESKSLVDKFDNIIYFNFLVNLQKWSYLKQNQTNTSYNKVSNCGDIDDFVEMESNNLVVSTVFDSLEFLNYLINMPEFAKNSVFIKSCHDFLTNFIIFMPKMIKELVRINSGYFALLLEVIGSLYGLTTSDYIPAINKELIELLVTDYWSHHELKTSCDTTTLQVIEDNVVTWLSHNNQDSYKTSTLFKFIRDCGDLVQDQNIYVSYVYMLKGMCCNNKLALYIYCLLNNNALRGQQSFRLSWEWFSECLNRHAEFWSGHLNQQHMISQEETDGLIIVLQLIEQVCKMNSTVRDILLQNETLRLPINIIVLLTCRLPECLKAEFINCLSGFSHNNNESSLTIWRYLESSCFISFDRQCQIQMLLDEVEPRLEEYNMTKAFIGYLLEICPFILSNKTTEPAKSLNDSKILNLQSITLSKYHEMNVFTNTLQVVINSVFLKHNSRTYRLIDDKYKICTEFLSLAIKCVEMFLIKVVSVKATKGHLTWCQFDPGFMLTALLISDSPLLRTLITMIEQGPQLINDALNSCCVGNCAKSTVDFIEKSIDSALQLIWMVLRNESVLVPLMRDLISVQRSRRDVNECTNSFLKNKTFVLDEPSKLLVSTSNNFNILVSLVKYADLVEECESIARRALAVLNSCVKSVKPHSHLILILTNKQKFGANLMPVLINCIEKYGLIDEKNLLTQMSASQSYDLPISDTNPNNLINLLFKQSSTDLNHISSVNYNLFQSHRTLVFELIINLLSSQSSPNLGQYLMGFDTSTINSIKSTCLQEAGVGDFPKTCLHTLLNLVRDLLDQILSSPCLDDRSSVLNYQAEISLINNSVNLQTPNVVHSPTDVFSSIYHQTSLLINMIDLDLIYRIFVLLASNPHTGTNFMRFIRSNYQLLINQIDLMVCSSNKLNYIPEARSMLLHLKSLLLQLFALEVKYSNQQNEAYMNKLLKVLLGEDLFEDDVNFNFKIYENGASQSEGLLISLLNDFELTQPEDCVDFCISRRFKSEILNEYLNMCGQSTHLGVTLIDSVKLRQLIMADINLPIDEPNNSSAVVLDSVQELQVICGELVTRFNHNAMLQLGGKLSAIDSWSQLLELIVLLSRSSIGTAVKYRKFSQLLHHILELITMHQSLPQNILGVLCRAALIVSSVLNAMLCSNHSIVTTNHNQGKLDGYSIGRDSDRIYLDVQQFKLINQDDFTSSIKLLSCLTIEALTKLNPIPQNTRIKLYGTLIYLLQLINKSQASLNDQMYKELVNDIMVYTLNTSSVSCTTDQYCVGGFYSVVCRDCISSNTHLLLCSFSLIQNLIDLSLDSTQQNCHQLIYYLVNDGYLQHIIDGLSKDANDTIMCIRSSSHNDIVLSNSNYTGDVVGPSLVDIMENSVSYYTLQCRVSLLNKLALTAPHSSASIKALINCELISNLIKCVDLYRYRPSPINNCDTTPIAFSSLICSIVNLISNLLLIPKDNNGNDLMSPQLNDSIEVIPRHVIQFSMEYFDVLTSPFVHSFWSLMHYQVVQEMINTANFFVLLLPNVVDSDNSSSLHTSQKHISNGNILIEKIRNISFQTISNLLLILNESPLFNPLINDISDENDTLLNDTPPQNTMLMLLQTQLFCVLIQIISTTQSINSPISGGAVQLFTNNIDADFTGDSLQFNSSNWSHRLNKLKQTIQTGNKPPVTLLTMILWKLLNLYEQVQQRLQNKFPIDLNNNKCTVTCENTNSNGGVNQTKSSFSITSQYNLDETLDSMSIEQLKLLYYSIFDDNSCYNTTNQHYLKLHPNCDKGNFVNQTNNAQSLMADIMLVFQKLTSISRELIVAIENSCYLLWFHCEIMKAAHKTQSTNNMLPSNNYDNQHPLLRLQAKQEQQQKLQSINNNPRSLLAPTSQLKHQSNSRESEPIGIQQLAKCFDDEMLRKIQHHLTEQSSIQDNSKGDNFIKVIVHQLKKLFQM